MSRIRAAFVFLALPALVGAEQAESPEELLERIRARVKESLHHLPDYVCDQTVQRWRTAGSGKPWDRQDTLRLEVSLIGGQEAYGWSGGGRLGDRELGELIGRGSVGTGSFALHARNVFSSAPGYIYVGEVDLADGRKAVRYDFEVYQDRSAYRVRVPPKEAIVAYRGAFWVHPETLDLIKLTVEADEMPAGIPVAGISDSVEYTRVSIGGAPYLLPKAAEFVLIGAEGERSRNLTQFEACRQYAAESKLVFDGQTVPEPAAAPAESHSVILPAREVIELALDTEIDPLSAEVGGEVRALVAKPIKDGATVLAAEGTPVIGRLTRLDREDLPFPHFVLAFEFHTLDLAGRAAPFRATMVDAVGKGVMRVQKRFMPTFDKRRKAPVMSILVREQQAGQGVIHWDARQGKMPKNLRMKWEIQPGE